MAHFLIHSPFRRPPPRIHFHIRNPFPGGLHSAVEIKKKTKCGLIYSTSDEQSLEIQICQRMNPRRREAGGGGRSEEEGSGGDGKNRCQCEWIWEDASGWIWEKTIMVNTFQTSLIFIRCSDDYSRAVENYPRLIVGSLYWEQVKSFRSISSERSSTSTSQVLHLRRSSTCSGHAPPL